MRSAVVEERSRVTQRIKIDQGGLGFGLWMVGWLFTIGFLDLSFWRGFLGLFVWPVFLGTRIAELIGS